MVQLGVKAPLAQTWLGRSPADEDFATMASAPTLRKWRMVGDFPEVAERLASFVDDGMHPQPDLTATYYFLPIAELDWPDDLNRGWATTLAPEVYERAVKARCPELSAGELLVASTAEFGDVLVAPEQFVFPL